MEGLSRSVSSLGRSVSSLVAPEGAGAARCPCLGTGLGGVHVVRVLLLIPFVFALLFSWVLRDVYLDRSFFASPVSFLSTDVGACIPNLVRALGWVATMLSHVLEAYRRRKLPMEPAASDATKPRMLRGCFSWRLNAGSMAVWDTFDCVETTIIAVCCSGGYLVDLAYQPGTTWGHDDVGLVVGWIPGIFGSVYLFKRMLFATAAVQRERMPGLLIGTAVPVLALALAFQLSILFVYANASLSYPYSDPSRPIAASSYMAGMLVTGNNSLIQCDDENAFWASFQLPFTFGRGVLEHGHTYDCVDELCGYRSWVDLCLARRVSFVAHSTDEMIEELIWVPVIWVVVAGALLGSGRIARTVDGELHLKRLKAPHIVLVIVLSSCHLIITLNLLGMFFLQAPLLVQGQAPADPLAACGPGSFCWFFANNEVGSLWVGVPAVALLGIDTLKSVVNRYNRRNRNRTYFLSYKQDNGNDGAVQMLANQPGFVGSVWLDKLVEDRSEEGMIGGVTSQDVFVAILSPKYFDSKFCCLEMHTALKMGKPMLVVWNQSKFTVQAALGWVQALPQLELTTLLKRNELLPIQEDIQMAGTCAARIKEAKVKPRSPLALSMIGEHTFLQDAVPDSLHSAGEGAVRV